MVRAWVERVFAATRAGDPCPALALVPVEVCFSALHYQVAGQEARAVVAEVRDLLAFVESIELRCSISIDESKMVDIELLAQASNLALDPARLALVRCLLCEQTASGVAPCSREIGMHALSHPFKRLPDG